MQPPQRKKADADPVREDSLEPDPDADSEDANGSEDEDQSEGELEDQPEGEPVHKDKKPKKEMSKKEKKEKKVKQEDNKRAIPSDIGDDLNLHARDIQAIKGMVNVFMRNAGTFFFINLATRIHITKTPPIYAGDGRGIRRRVRLLQTAQIKSLVTNRKNAAPEAARAQRVPFGPGRRKLFI